MNSSSSSNNQKESIDWVQSLMSDEPDATYKGAKHRIYNRDMPPYDLEQVAQYIDKHCPVKVLVSDSGLMFQKDDLSAILSLVQKVNFRFGDQLKGQAPVFIEGNIIKFKSHLK